jgi:hypothetical protein
MNKFKSIVGRVNYAHDFDVALEKAISTLVKEGSKIVQLHITMSEMQVLCLVEYAPSAPKKPQQAKKPSSKKKVVEEVDGSAEAPTA